MNINEAERIISETEDDFLQENVIMRGLQILSEYEKDVRCGFEHDIIFASGFRETAPRMSREDILQMARLGWFCQSGCWAHY